MTEMLKKSAVPSLTPREREIIKLIAEGLNDTEIADQLFVSEMLVKESQINLMRKLNTEDMTSAIDYAIENDLITLFEILESRFSRKDKGPDDYIQ